MDIKSERRVLFGQLMDNLVTKRGRLLDHEQLCVKKMMKDVNLEHFKNRNKNVLLAALTDVCNAQLDKFTDEKETNIDVHEMLVTEIGRESETALKERKIDITDTVDKLLGQPKVLQSIFNPHALHKKAYLILDRKFQSSDANNFNEFKWQVSSGNRIRNSVTTVTTAPLKDVTKIKMFPFKLGASSAVGLVTDFGQLSVEIVEMNTQAWVVANTNKKFHFMFDITGSNPYMIGDTGNSTAEFEFHEYIVELNTITVRFGNPYDVIGLDVDYLFGSVAAVGVQTELTFTTGHNCLVGSYVVIERFNTTNAVADKTQIDNMNLSRGWPIIGITTTVITINVDLSGLSGAITGGPFRVYFNGKRFALKLELTYVS